MNKEGEINGSASDVAFYYAQNETGRGWDSNSEAAFKKRHSRQRLFSLETDPNESGEIERIPGPKYVKL